VRPEVNGAALGFRSELIFHRSDGEVIDLRTRHGCLLIRTPSNPTFFWGNYLLFDRAPVAGDERRWQALFEELIERVQPASTHRAYGWLQDAAGDVDAFLAAGYTRNDATVLHATRLRPVPAPAIAARLRPFASEADWAMQLDDDVAFRDPAHEEAHYRAFCERRNARWRALIAAGRGQWFGAFVADGGHERLAASLGVFAEAQPEEGERLARFQNVLTHPEFRRQGLCRALLAFAAHYAQHTLRADRLVIVAAAGEMPEQLYRAVGFEPAGRQRGLQRMPPR
jgi:GNAT superfamily N-acetyltransferase